MIQEAQLQTACCDLVAEVVRSAGSASLKVTGLSMLPAIWPGDVLTVRSLSPDLLQPGQIVLYRRDGKLTAHRIHRVAGAHLVTRGDSVPSLDPPVRASEVVGQVVAIRRNGRTVNLQASFWQRAAAGILRRSQRGAGLLMRLRAALLRLTALAAKLQQIQSWCKVHRHSQVAFSSRKSHLFGPRLVQVNSESALSPRATPNAQQNL